MLIPFVLAIFLTLCLIPAIDVQMKWLRIPRRTAILTTVLIGCTILVLAIPGGIQFVVGNLLQPKLMGESLDLHPVVVLLSLIFFGTIWGVIGMFLAVPITAVAKIFLQRFGYTRALADLAGGKTDVLMKAGASGKV